MILLHMENVGLLPPNDCVAESDDPIVCVTKDYLVFLVYLYTFFCSDLECAECPTDFYLRIGNSPASCKFLMRSPTASIIVLDVKLSLGLLGA